MLQSISNNLRLFVFSQRTSWLIPLIIWLLLLPGFVGSDLRLTSDSASYIDCARSILKGDGFLFRWGSGVEPHRWEPFKLWPPGYPLLIAAAVWMGFSYYAGALAVSLLFSTLSVWLIGLFYSRFFRASVAALLAGLILVTKAPFVHVLSMCWSEGPFLFFTTLSLLFFIRAHRSSDPASWNLFLAGCAGGLSYCIRNTGLALSATAILYMFLRIRTLGFKNFQRCVLLYSAGWAATSLWLVIHNLVVFRKINPYYGRPSEFSALDNLLAITERIGVDFLGSSVLRFTSGSPVVALGAIISFAIVLYYLIFIKGINIISLKNYIHDSIEEQILALYLLIYVATIVVAFTRFQWGEPLGSRYLVPVYWILSLFLARLAVAASRLLDNKKLLLVLYAGLFVYVMVQAKFSFNVAAKYYFDTDYRNALISENRRIVTLAERISSQVPPTMVVLSDYSRHLKVFGNVDARGLPGTNLFGGESPLTWRDVERAGKDKRLWGFVLFDAANFVKEPEYPAEVRNMVSLLASSEYLYGFRVKKEGPAVIAEYIGDPAPVRTTSGR